MVFEGFMIFDKFRYDLENEKLVCVCIVFHTQRLEKIVTNETKLVWADVHHLLQSSSHHRPLWWPGRVRIHSSSLCSYSQTKKLTYLIRAITTRVRSKIKNTNLLSSLVIAIMINTIRSTLFFSLFPEFCFQTTSFSPLTSQILMSSAKKSLRTHVMPKTSLFTISSKTQWTFTLTYFFSFLLIRSSPAKDWISPRLPRWRSLKHLSQRSNSPPKRRMGRSLKISTTCSC